MIKKAILLILILLLILLSGAVIKDNVYSSIERKDMITTDSLRYRF